MAILATLIGPAATQTPSSTTLERIFEQFSSTDLEVKNKAGEEGRAYIDQWLHRDIGGMREDLPVLIKALKQGHPDVRVTASAFLGTVALFRPRDVLEVVKGYEAEILAGFEDPQLQVRANLIRCFATAEPAPPLEAVEPFKSALLGPPSEARRLAVVGLARAAPGSLAAADAIIEVLDGAEDPEERRGLIQVLGAAKPTHPVIIEKLVEQLDESDAQLVEDTMRTLGEIGSPAAAQATEKLRAIASNPNADQQLRDSAASTLRLIGAGAASQRP